MHHFTAAAGHGAGRGAVAYRPGMHRTARAGMVRVMAP
jgi:hypothetical protein